jgi:hypothetical protein
MKLADRHGRPLSQVLSEYEEWELPYWASWFAHEPSDGKRVEIAIAQLTRNFIASNLKKGRKPPKIDELLIPDWWIENNKRAAARRDINTLTQAFVDSGIPIKINSRGNH